MTAKTLVSDYYQSGERVRDAHTQLRDAEAEQARLASRLRSTVEFSRSGSTTTLKKGTRVLKLTYGARGWRIKENGRVVHPRGLYTGVNDIRLGFALGEF